MHKRKIAIGAAIVTALALAGAASASAGTPQPSARTGNVSAPAHMASGKQRPWTAARMAHAKNLDTLTVQKGGPSKLRAIPRRETSGVPQTVAPASGSLSSSATTARAVTQTDGIASKFRRPYSSFTERTNAKIFFVQDGGDYVCSGTIVNSDTKHMVNTAGHCVADGFGNWSSDMVVVPAYSSSCNGCGDHPYGVWNARTESTKTAWLYYGDLNMDYGYIVLKNKPNKGAIVNYLGGRGMAWNYDWIQNFQAMGYPQAFPFNGYTQWKVNGTSLWLDDPSGLGETPTIAMPNNLTGGSSGGAWDISLGGQPYVNGHNDYKYTDDNSVMYSPYYGSDEQDLFNYTVGLG